MANNVVIQVNLQDLASNELKKLQGGFSDFQKTVLTLGATFHTLRVAFDGITNAFQKMSEVISVTAEFERMGVALKTVTGGAIQAKEALDWIKDFTATTPFELGEVGDAFTRLSAIGIKNIPAELKMLGDLASAFGKDLSTSVDAFTGVLVGRTVMLKQFGITVNQVGEQMTFNWAENGKAMSRTINKNKDEVIQLLHEITKRFDGAMDNLLKTFMGRVSNMNDVWKLLLEEIGLSSGVFDEVKAIVSTLEEAFKQLKKEVDFRALLNDVLLVFKEMVQGMVQIMKELVPVIATIREGFDGLFAVYKLSKLPEATVKENELKKRYEYLQNIINAENTLEGMQQKSKIGDDRYYRYIEEAKKEIVTVEKAFRNAEKERLLILTAVTDIQDQSAKRAEALASVEQVLNGVKDIYLTKVKEVTAETQKQKELIESMSGGEGWGLNFLIKKFDEIQETLAEKNKIFQSNQTAFNKELKKIYDDELKKYELYNKTKIEIQKIYQNSLKEANDKKIKQMWDLAKERDRNYKESVRMFNNFLKDVEKTGKELNDKARKEAVQYALNTATDMAKSMMMFSGAFGGNAEEMTIHIKDAFGELKDFAQDTAQAMNTFFSDFFFDAFKGELDSLSDYFNSFLDSILKSLSNMLAQNVTNESIGMIGGSFSGALNGSSATYTQATTQTSPPSASSNPSARQATAKQVPVTVNIQNNSQSQVAVQELSFNPDEKIIDVIVKDAMTGGRTARLFGGR
jgi:hypothetical protein